MGEKRYAVHVDNSMGFGTIIFSKETEGQYRACIGLVYDPIKLTF
mgnify:CR=1 FL=1